MIEDQQELDITTVLNTLTQNPALRPVLESLLSSVIGNNSLGLSPFGVDISKTRNYNLYQQQKSTLSASYTGPIIDDLQNQYNTEILLPNIYASLGYNQEEIATKIQEEPLWQKMMLNPFIGGQFFAQQTVGARGVIQAAEKRKDLYDSQNGYEYFQSVGQGVKDILKAQSEGELGPYTLDDAYALSSRLMSVDTSVGYTKDRDDNNRRLSNITQGLQDYSKIASDLKNSLDGPLAEMLDQFEQFTGGANIMAMKKSRLEATTRSFRNNVVFNDLTPAEVAQYSSMGISSLGQLGAEAQIGRAFGMNTSSVAAQTVMSEGVTNADVAETYTNFSQTNYASGYNRRLAAAATLYADLNNEGDLDKDTYDNFIASMGDNLSERDLNRYLEDNGAGAYFLDSKEVAFNQGLTFIADDTNRLNMESMWKIQKESLTGVNSSEAWEEIVTGLTGEESDSDLRSLVGGIEGITIEDRERLISRIQYAQLGALGFVEEDANRAAATIRSIRRASDINSKTLVGDDFLRILTGNSSDQLMGEKGLAGALGLLTDTNNSKGSIELKDYIAATLGITPQSVKASELSEEEKETLYKDSSSLFRGITFNRTKDAIAKLQSLEEDIARQGGDPHYSGLTSFVASEALRSDVHFEGLSEDFYTDTANTFIMLRDAGRLNNNSRDKELERLVEIDSEEYQTQLQTLKKASNPIQQLVLKQSYHKPAEALANFRTTLLDDLEEYSSLTADKKIVTEEEKKKVAEDKQKLLAKIGDSVIGLGGSKEDKSYISFLVEEGLVNANSLELQSSATTQRYNFWKERNKVNDALTETIQTNLDPDSIAPSISLEEGKEISKWGAIIRSADKGSEEYKEAQESFSAFVKRDITETLNNDTKYNNSSAEEQDKMVQELSKSYQSLMDQASSNPNGLLGNISEGLETIIGQIGKLVTRFTGGLNG